MRKAVLFAIAVLFMGHLVKNDLWAEPKPPVKTAFSVAINKKAYTESEVELVVTVLSKGGTEEEDFSDDIRLLANAVQAEAGTEPLEGKRMVAAVILNRVDSEDFPNDIRSVLEQRGQFSSVSNGSINRVEPTQETLDAVSQELDSRSDETVIYFRTKKYHVCGKPVCQIGRHYFSAK